MILFLSATKQEQKSLQIQELPSVEICAGVSEINHIFNFVDVHIVGEEQSPAFNLRHQWGGQTSIWLHHLKPKVGICDIQISRFLVKSQPQRPSTYMFHLRSKRPHTLLPSPIKIRVSIHRILSISKKKKKPINSKLRSTVPFGSGDSKIGPSAAIPFPFKNPAVCDAGVGPFPFGVESYTLRSEGSGDLDYFRAVQEVMSAGNRRRFKEMI